MNLIDILWTKEHYVTLYDDVQCAKVTVTGTITYNLVQAIYLPRTLSQVFLIRCGTSDFEENEGNFENRVHVRLVGAEGQGCNDPSRHKSYQKSMQ